MAWIVSWPCSGSKYYCRQNVMLERLLCGGSSGLNSPGQWWGAFFTSGLLRSHPADFSAASQCVGARGLSEGGDDVYCHVIWHVIFTYMLGSRIISTARLET